jgi:hypothetical protein
LLLPLFKDSDPFEKLHIKFIKEILGIHCKASNDGCRAELNRTSLKSKILFSIFKVQAFLKKWWVESDFKAPNLPLSLRLKVSGCHYNSIYNNT